MLDDIGSALTGASTFIGNVGSTVLSSASNVLTSVFGGGGSSVAGVPATVSTSVSSAGVGSGVSGSSVWIWVVGIGVLVGGFLLFKRKGRLW